MTLNDKQKAFVRQYLKDFNATQAALRAGYAEVSAHSQAHDLLKKPEIKQAINEHLDNVGATAERILLELANIAFADMADYATVEPGGGIRLKAFEEMPDGATKVIKKLKEKRKLLAADGADEEDSGNVILESQIEYEHHDKLKALELLGKYRSMFMDKMKLSGDKDNPVEVNIDISKASSEQLMDIIKGLGN